MIRLVTHNDLDGSGCAIVAKYFFGDKVKISHADYNTIGDFVGEILETFRGYDQIYFADICPEEEDVIKLSKLNNVLILDHHISRQEFSGKYDIVAIDINQCGAKFFYSHLLNKFGENSRNNKLEEFLEYVDTFDRWILDNPEKKKKADDLNMIFSFYGSNWFETERGFDPGQDILEKERFILKILKHKELLYIKQQLNKIRPFKINDYLFGLSFANKSVPKLSDTINNIGIVDGLIVPDLQGDSVSLYSKTVDVSKIATRMGGGGHKGASGFSLNLKDLVEKFLKNKLGR